ncbi:MAG: Crp/Fnr family transcriptional regulator [Planctomycetota bacterium]
MTAASSPTDILHRAALFRGLPPPALARVAGAARPARLAAGQCLYREGDTCADVAILGDGLIRVFKSCPSGREITLYHVEPGEPCLVNVLCAYLQSPTPASATVERPGPAVLVPHAVFHELIGAAAPLRDQLFGSIARRMLDLMLLVEEVAFRRMDRRLASYLRKRFDQSRSDELWLEITHEEIAADLGSAREVISRLVKEFERLGVVQQGRGRIGLRDPGRLQDLADIDLADGKSGPV